MALAPPERLTDSRPRSMSKLAESPAGLVPAPLISGRMMTPTKPQSAGLGGGSSTAASGVRRRPGSRGVKKEAYVDPSVSQALAAALKAELALAEFDATPEIFGEILPLQVPVLIGGGGGNSSGGGGYHPSFQLQQQQQPHSQHNNGGTPKHHDRHHHHNHHHHPNHNHHHHNNHHHNHHHHNHHPNNTPTPQPPPPPPQPYVPTPENIRARAEKAAEFEVEHNWLLKEEAEIKVKKFDATKRKLAIFLPDDDPLEGISNRLEEIQSMVKPKAELSNFLEDLSTDQRDKILQVADADTEELIKDRRQNWKSADIIRNTFRMIYIMVCQCHPGRRYFNPDDPEAGPAIMRRQRKIYGQGKAPIKSSLSEDMQLSLTKHPAYRTPHDIKRVMWVLRATKAFKHLFPTEMEREVAKVVGYERYDDNRHLAYQGRSSTRFYYVLSGRIQQLKEYRLTSGCVNKSMGIWNKGMTSDPEELEQGWYRESHLVSKGPVEVLILDKDDFIRLQHTVQGPPVDFLWSIDLFKEFPCDDFHDNPDAIEFKYYGQNRIVARDINRTPWLHVVKSGIVKVVRVQYVFDVRNEKKFSTQSTEELGCGRSFSHAQAMLGLLAKQRRMKTLTASEICLPDLFQRRSLMSVEDGRRGKRRKSHFLQQLSQKSASIAGDVPVIFVEDTKVDMGEDSGSTPSHSGKQKSSDLVLPPIVQSGREPTFSASSSAQLRGNAQAHGPSSAKPSQASNTNDDDDDADNNDNDDDERTSGAAQEHKGAGPENTQSVSSAGSKRAGSGAMPRMTEAPLLVPHGTFLTREKTVPDTHTHLIPPGVVFGKKEKKDALVRKAYLQLDLLKPGDVFGLDDLAQKLRFNKNEIEEPGVYPKDLGLENLDHPAIPMNEGPAISLVSDGAEVIKISKRFFLQHAQNNTMLRVETMQRSYLSTDEAKSILYDKETWAQYKHVLMQRLIDGLPR